MNKFPGNTDMDFLNMLCAKVKSMDPSIIQEGRARKVIFKTIDGKPKKFAEIKCGGALTFKFYRQKEKARLYPSGKLESKANRRPETYKKLFPGDNYSEALQLAKKAFRMSRKV